MIEGYFRDDAAWVPLMLVANEGVIPVEFVVDTGFTDALSLPIEILQRVRSQPNSRKVVRLADGTLRIYAVHLVEIRWYDDSRLVNAIELEDDPLIGIALLREYHLHIEITEGGEVVAEPL